MSFINFQAPYGDAEKTQLFPEMKQYLWNCPFTHLFLRLRGNWCNQYVQRVCSWMRRQPNHSMVAVVMSKHCASLTSKWWCLICRGWAKFTKDAQASPHCVPLAVVAPFICSHCISARTAADVINQPNPCLMFLPMCMMHRAFYWSLQIEHSEFIRFSAWRSMNKSMPTVIGTRERMTAAKIPFDGG